MVSQNLADLIHELQFRIWFEFRLIFHLSTLLAPPEMTKRNMTDKSDIIEEHLLGRKLIGVWEMISDSSPTTVEGYALSWEGYFLEI